ncbi:hypothetical protein HBI71_079050 [Parastagonospora nodorum]|nr:hypothetical protein HBI71_079050 [Parastagonospora nodorum]
MLFLTSYAIEKVHICAADSLSSTMITHNRRLAGELATAESITAKEPLIARGNNILLLIAFIISYCLFADKLVYALNRVTVVLIIILVDKTQLSLILGDVARLTPSTLLARFIPTTKIRDPLLKTLENAAKSRILLACADRRTRQCYLTICAILRCLDKGHDDFVYLVNYFRWKHYNFNIHVSLATDTLHLLLKGLVIKMLDFITSLKRFNNKRAFTEAIIQQLIAIVSLLFILKAPFALHFIRAVCDLVILAQYKRALERINVFKEKFQVYQRTLREEKNFNYSKALDSICTRANSEAHYITIVKQFYSITNKKETALLAADYATIVKQSQLKRHNDSKHCNKELYLILIIINYTRYDKDRKHIAYIRAFSKVLLFNNNRQIDNTTRILSMPFKFYDLSTIICPVHLVPRDLPNLTTCTTMSYYVNNYIN